MLLRILVGLSLILPLAGCALAPAVATCELQTATVRDFARQLRWRETGTALKLTSPPPAGVRAAWQEALRQVEPVDCTVKELSCTPGATQATSTLSLDYLRSGSATLKRSDLPLVWQFRADQGWSIVSPPPPLP
jgi:hypothetical protein